MDYDVRLYLLVKTDDLIPFAQIVMTLAVMNVMMPSVIRFITALLPARSYVALLQTVFLAGDIWSVLLPNAAVLFVMTGLLALWSPCGAAPDFHPTLRVATRDLGTELARRENRPARR